MKENEQERQSFPDWKLDFFEKLNVVYPHRKETEVFLSHLGHTVDFRPTYWRDEVERALSREETVLYTGIPYCGHCKIVIPMIVVKRYMALWKLLFLKPPYGR